MVSKHFWKICMNHVPPFFSGIQRFKVKTPFLSQGLTVDCFILEGYKTPRQYNLKLKTFLF